MQFKITSPEKSQSVFFIFRFLYNSRLTYATDCQDAFEQSKVLFYIDHGYCPYQDLAEYLADLDEINDFFQRQLN